MHPEPRIALAHDHLFQYGGAEQVVREFARMFPQAPLYTLVRTGNVASLFSDIDVRTSWLQQVPGKRRFFKWCVPFMARAWEFFDFSEYDVVLSSSSGFVKGLRVTGNTKHICYCHTPARYLWPDSTEYLESLRIPRPMKSYLAELLARLREWDLMAAKRVDHFLANSHFIASRIQKFYGRSSTVIHPPIDTSRFKVADTHDAYYLIVSRLRPYKRVDIAIKAFNNLRLPLVIAGSGEEYHRLKRMSKGTIRFVGEVSDAERNRLLSRCKAFIHPQEEDFGISAVEAMASGRPVIAYRAGGALETVAEGTSGVFFDEQSWESLAYAVLKREYEQLDPLSITAHAKRFDASVFRERIEQFLSSARTQ